MPELREIFEMTTKQIEPDLDVWRRQEEQQLRHRARRRAAAIGVVLAIALVAGFVAVDLARTPSPSTTPGGGNGGGRAAVLHLVGQPSGIVEAGGSVWVATFEGLVYRIDPATNSVGEPIDLGIHVCGEIAVHGDAIYISACGYWPPTDTARIDTTTGAVTDPWLGGLIAPVFGDGQVWASDPGANHGGPREIDPASGRVVDTLGDRYGRVLGYAFGSLWATEDNVVVRLDPITGAVTGMYTLPAGADTFAIHLKGGGFAVAGGYVWLTTYHGDVYGTDGPVERAELLRLDPMTDEVVDVMSLTLDPSMTRTDAEHPGPGPEVFPSGSGDTVWVARTPGSVVGIDARSLELTHTFAAAGARSTEVAATEGAVWIANYGDGTVWRYDLPSSG